MGRWKKMSVCAALFGRALMLGLAGCAEKPAGKPAYLEPSLPLEERVEDLLSRMTLEEKAGQMNWPCVYVDDLGESIADKLENCRRFAEGNFIPGLGPGGGFFTLANTILHQGPAQQAEYFNGLQKIALEKTRLGIPLIQVEEGTHGLMCSGGTIFPEGLALGSTWDLELIRRIYSTAAAEARAVGIHELFTLVVEPNRDPRLGRNQEGFSEDPFLCSRIAGMIVEGAQGQNIAQGDKVVAGLCHYPGQSQAVGGLEQGAMEISERMLREVFLPPWETGIRKKGALGVMATYPAIDGIPAHASRHLLTDILRGELGFEGLVLSEGDGFRTITDRHLAATQKEAGAIALRSGVDVGITYEPAYMLPLIENVREGKVPVELVDRAVRRILRLKFRLGLFENPYVDPGRAAKASHSPEHQELALQAAREGIVLLKNEGDMLPLDRTIRSIAVIGPNADNARNQLGDYTSNSILQEIVTVLEGVRGKVPEATRVGYVKGCEVIGGETGEIDRAVRLAAESDVALVVLGENERFAPGGAGTDGEHKDVASLDLTGYQQVLLEAVFKTGTPVVLVLINGRPLSIRWAAGHVPAILEAWICGEQGGNAVAEVLFGEYNPSGRLPISIPRHAGQLPVYYDQKPSRERIGGWRGYVDMPSTPLYEFGFGLSYTSFAYSNLQISPPVIGLAGEVVISVEVSNTGGRPGTEVVQLYLHDEIASVVRPAKQLKGFERISLEPQSRGTVEFKLTPEDLSLLGPDLKRVVEPGRFEVLIGSSSSDIRLKGGFEVRD